MSSIRCSFVLLLLLLATISVASAQSPDTFSFQGRLTQADGTDVTDGSYSVDFALHTESIGGAQVWRETQTVTTKDGIFTVQLGLIQPFGALAFDEPYYLSLTVEGETLTPRTPLTATPYAMQAHRLHSSALRAGSNMTITEDSDGILRISSSGSDSGLANVTSDGTLSGDGTAGNPLGLSSEAIQAGSNVSVAQDGNGRFTISSTGGEGIASIASNGTLLGDGTVGSPLAVSVPLELSGTARFGVVRGEHTNGNYGVFGTEVFGVYGEHSSGSRGWIGSDSQGVYGEHSNGHLGILADANNGVLGQNSNGNFGWVGGTIVSVLGKHSNGNQGGIGEVGFGAAGQHGSSGNMGHLGGPVYGAYGEHNSTGNSGYLGSDTYGAAGVHTSGNRGYFGGPGVGAYGEHSTGNLGYFGSTFFGAYGQHGGTLNWGHFGGMSYGAYGQHGSSGNWAGLGGASLAGQFVGDVAMNNDLAVTGTLSKGGGSFKIDHPLDPENKYLSHSFVESPDMMNVYNGNITTSANGEATVTLPDYFEALNRDFRYQLTVIGQFAQAIVAEKVQGNRFVIRTNKPGVEVSWQVTGIRQDAWANENRIPTEEMKPAEARGYYLHPRAFGLPMERIYEYTQLPTAESITPSGQ